MTRPAGADDVQPAPPPSLNRTLAVYVALVVLPVAGLLLALRSGARLIAPDVPPALDLVALTPASMALLRPSVLFAQIVTIMIVSRLVGRLFVRMRQPRVVGEMMAGILLGPSVLGWLVPGAYDLLFPRGSVRFLNALSQVGLLLFMFLVGLEVDVASVRKQGRAVLIAAHAGIAIPMFLGVAASLLLYPVLSSSAVPFRSFALFLGVALSVTAFPVLARILAERAWTNTVVGNLAIASAAVSDVTAWCILALVVAVARDDATRLPLWVTVGGVVLLILAMATIGRRLVNGVARRLTDRNDPEKVNDDALAAVLVITLLCALATEMLGVHALFGAFLAGIIIPKEQGVVGAIQIRLREMLALLLMPIFFTRTGILLQVDLISGSAWLLCGLVTLLAVAGKLGGTALAARFCGSPWRHSFSLGVLMNTRGLMELVVLNIGLEAKVISREVYAMLVIMALVTTMATTPLLKWTAPKGYPPG